MLRRIIKINEELCNGCGICVDACHEGAIGLVNGKARLMRDDYCDGLGDCLPGCPTGAITFEEREATAYNEAAVRAAKMQKETLPCGCPGTHVQSLKPQMTVEHPSEARASELRQWPVQMKLVPVNAPYFADADILVAADCTAFAYGSFHQDFMRGKITLIGCPKLDEGDYSEKLTAVFRENRIRSVTVTRMSVPCCKGLENAVQRAIENCGKEIPLEVAVIPVG